MQLKMQAKRLCGKINSNEQIEKREKKRISHQTVLRYTIALEIIQVREERKKILPNKQRSRL